MKIKKNMKIITIKGNCQQNDMKNEEEEVDDNNNIDDDDNHVKPRYHFLIVHIML